MANSSRIRDRAMLAVGSSVFALGMVLFAIYGIACMHPAVVYSG